MLTAQDPDRFRDELAEDVARKKDAPGAETLLYVLGYVYAQECMFYSRCALTASAKRHSKRFLGIGGFFHGVSARFHMLKEVVSVTMAVSRMQVAEVAHSRSLAQTKY